MGFKSQLSHYQRMQLSQVKYLNDMADAFSNRTKSTHLRREILQKQDQRNYRSEYERIRNHVENSATPALTKKHITDRQAHLNKLFSLREFRLGSRGPVALWEKVVQYQFGGLRLC